MASFAMVRRRRESSCTLLCPAFCKLFAVDSRSRARPVARDVQSTIWREITTYCRHLTILGVETRLRWNEEHGRDQPIVNEGFKARQTSLRFGIARHLRDWLSPNSNRSPQERNSRPLTCRIRNVLGQLLQGFNQWKETVGISYRLFNNLLVRELNDLLSDVKTLSSRPVIIALSKPR